MSTEQNFLDVRIMGREYRIACTPEESRGLQAAVDLVDAKMSEIAQRTKSTIAERVAVMAALNIAHEHLSDTPPAAENDVDYSVDTSDAKRRIFDMGARIDTVLAPQQQLDL